MTDSETPADRAKAVLANALRQHGKFDWTAEWLSERLNEALTAAGLRVVSASAAPEVENALDNPAVLKAAQELAHARKLIELAHGNAQSWKERAEAAEARVRELEAALEDLAVTGDLGCYLCDVPFVQGQQFKHAPNCILAPKDNKAEPKKNESTEKARDSFYFGGHGSQDGEAD